MGAPILVVVPFGFGLALLTSIFAFGSASGAHYNPAVTLAALLDRQIGPLEAGAYILAQVIGAIGASALVGVVAGGSDQVTLTRNALGQGVTPLSGFVIEVVLAAIFLAVILTTARRVPAHAPFVIPLTLVMIHMAGIPFSGASVNPARSLGPALVSGNLSDIWIYLTAPLVGGAIGWALYRVFEAGEIPSAGD
jgi:aquaporin Z